MIYDHRYTEYQDFAGVMFPTVLHSHQGDPRIHPGHNWMEIRVTNAQVNVNAAALTRAGQRAAGHSTGSPG